MQLPPHALISPELERQVYAALLDSLARGAGNDTLLLKDSTLVFRMREVRTVPAWRVQFDSIPGELAPLLAAESATRRASATLSMPRPTRTVTSAELTEIFAHGPGKGWQLFYERYPTQRRFIGLSPIAFSPDGGSALLYYEYHCGGLCGGGNAVWLTRTAEGKWTVRKVLMFWVS